MNRRPTGAAIQATMSSGPKTRRYEGRDERGRVSTTAPITRRPGTTDVRLVTSDL
jgi:hypothetical protein